LIIDEEFFSFRGANLDLYDNVLNKVQDWNPRITRKSVNLVFLLVFMFFAPNLFMILWTWLLSKYFDYFIIFEYALSLLFIYFQADLLSNVLISSVYIYKKIDKGENNDLIEL